MTEEIENMSDEEVKNHYIELENEMLKRFGESRLEEKVKKFDE